MKKCYSFDILLAVLLLILTFPVFSADFKAIKDPKPNIIETEKHYVQLEKVKTIDADLGNGMYLFRPFSIAVSNDSDDVYIYDNLQAKIFIMDSELKTVKGAFGGKGVGPGELGGTGKSQVVFIRKGRDGKLYAYCPRMRKIVVYDQNGKFIRDIKSIDDGIREPLVDASGNLYNLAVKDKMIIARNEKKVSLFSLAKMEDNFDFLFSTPGSLYLRMVSLKPEGELLTALTVKSRFLLYFPSSSTMVIVENNKISKQFRLWPKDAFSCYLTKIAELNNRNSQEERRERAKKTEETQKKSFATYLPLFPNLFVDESDDGVFYLELGRNEKNGTHSLYQFNDNGHLLKVLYVKFEKTAGEDLPFIHFKAIKNDRFYAVHEDKLILYKEVGK